MLRYIFKTRNTKEKTDYIITSEKSPPKEKKCLLAYSASVGTHSFTNRVKWQLELADVAASNTGKLFLPWLKLYNLGLKPSSLKATGKPIDSSCHTVKKDAIKCYFFNICLTAETAMLQGGCCVGR